MPSLTARTGKQGRKSNTIHSIRRVLQNNKTKVSTTQRYAKVGATVKGQRACKVSVKVPTGSVRTKSKEVVAQLPSFTTSLSPAIPHRPAPNLVKGFVNQGVNVGVRRSTDLLKWSVSLIAQSLAPLKKKDEYYSLIFIKILKTRGFLDLKNKIKASHQFNTKLTLTRSGLPTTTSQAARQLSKSTGIQHPLKKSGGYASPRTVRSLLLRRAHAHKEGTAAHSKQLVLQGKNKISLPKKGRVKPAATELDTNKLPLITFYPGGRDISD